MPYFFVEDLPANIQNILPKGAQEIYRKAFNKIWDQFRDQKKLPDGLERVELAAMAAWTCVKKKYIKSRKTKKWVKRKNNNSKR